VSTESKSLASTAPRVFNNLAETDERLNATSRTASHLRELAETIEFIKNCSLNSEAAKLDELTQKWLQLGNCPAELADAYEIFTGDKLAARIESARHQLSSAISAEIETDPNAFYFYLKLASRVNYKQPLVQLFQRIKDKFEDFASRIRTKASLVQQISLTFDFGREIVLDELKLLHQFPQNSWIAEVIVYVGSEAQNRALPLLAAFLTKNSLDPKVKELCDPTLRRNLTSGGWSSDLVSIDSLLTEMVIIVQKSNLFTEFLLQNAAKFTLYENTECFVKDLKVAEAHLMDIYVLFEQFYVKKSITKILKSGSAFNSESLTSDMLEDSFYILQKTCKRAHSTFSMKTIHQIVPFVFKLIGNPFYETMAKRFTSLNYEDPLKNKRESAVSKSDLDLA
jgi:hypothetical protein